MMIINSNLCTTHILIYNPCINRNRLIVAFIYFKRNERKRSNRSIITNNSSKLGQVFQGPRFRVSIDTWAK